ncbi:hypothetical protein [Rhizorhabdus argentea]|uniref:hypothetical protein n=1 Tax=Rhizorhabdus argentea TaxID=1387174 RepID=UPI0030EF6A22
MNNSPLNLPLKVAVIGPGGVGGACIREILREPSLELAGVLAFNVASSGRDAGELVGRPAAGVAVTTDLEEFLAIDVDCVLYTGAPPFDSFMEDVTVRLLEKGRNVISVTGFFFPPSQGETSLRRIEEACHRGQASLHGTGENPGFMLERLAVTASAIANTIERVSVVEAVNTASLVGEAMKQFGFGQDPATMYDGPYIKLLEKYLFVEAIEQTGVQLFGARPDRIEANSVYEAAKEPIELEIMTIEPGQVSVITHHYEGYYGDDAKISVCSIAYLRKEDEPFEGIVASDQWRIEVEGKPASIRLDVTAFASVERNLEVLEDDATMPCYYMTASILTQAIPVVCAAPPGIVYPKFFSHGGTLEKFRRTGRVE